MVLVKLSKLEPIIVVLVF